MDRFGFLTFNPCLPQEPQPQHPDVGTAAVPHSLIDFADIVSVPLCKTQKTVSRVQCGPQKLVLGCLLDGDPVWEETYVCYSQLSLWVDCPSIKAVLSQWVP